MDAIRDDREPAQQTDRRQRSVEGARPAGAEHVQLEERHADQHQPSGAPEPPRQDLDGVEFERYRGAQWHLRQPTAAIARQLAAQGVGRGLPVCGVHRDNALWRRQHLPAGQQREARSDRERGDGRGPAAHAVTRSETDTRPARTRRRARGCRRPRANRRAPGRTAATTASGDSGSLAGASPRAAAREVISTMPAPKSIENKVMNFWSASRRDSSQIHQFAPLKSPNAVGLASAAVGMANSWMLITRMPSSATPRRTSMGVIRWGSVTGPGALDLIG